MNVSEDIHALNLAFADMLWQATKESVAQAAEHFALTREQASIVRQLPLEHLQRSTCPNMLAMCPAHDIAGDQSTVSPPMPIRQKPPVGRQALRSVRGEPVSGKASYRMEMRSVRHGPQKAPQMTLAALKDLNVQYLFLLRRMAGQSLEEASVRFGLRQADVEFVRDVPLDQLTRLTSPACVQLTPRRLFLDRLAAGPDPIARSVALLRSLSDGDASKEDR